MVKKFVLFVFMLVLVSAVYALDKEELIQTYKTMSIDDLNRIEEVTFKIANDSALKTGYIKGLGMSVGGAGGFYYFMPNAAINDNKPAQAQGLSALYGGGGGFLVNLNPNLALGGLFGGMGGSTTSKVGANFYTYDVGAGFELLHAQVKPIINEQFIVGLDLGLGVAQGAYGIYVTDENLNGQDVVRNGGSALAYLLGLDVRKRITNFFFLSAKAGWFYTSFGTLKRGDFTDPAAKPLTISAPYLSIGMGGNF